MKNYLLFTLLYCLTLNSCKPKTPEPQITLENDKVTISKTEYDSLLGLANKLLVLPSSNLIKFEIDDALAKEFVQYYLKEGGQTINKKIERSVFFKFEEIASAINGVSIPEALKNYGFRIYFARYTNSEKAGVYLKTKFGNSYANYFNKLTVILQIMDKTNTYFQYKDAGNKDLLNYNLGELCPPCYNLPNPSGLDDDFYIKD